MPNTDVPQGQHDERGGPGGDNHPFHVIVRTLAGHQVRETVKPDDKVADLTREAVKYFVHKGELVDGEYALALPRGGEGELDPTSTLHHAGVREDDVLVLINRKPQVDG
jgi:hypothetical protein